MSIQHTNVTRTEMTLKEIKRAESKLPQFKQMMINESKYFLKKNFNLELNVPIMINPRLTSTYGRFIWYGSKRNNRPKYLIEKDVIEIQKNFILVAMIAGELEAVMEVLRHELVHYALFTLGRDYRDGDSDFEKTLAELNVGSSARTHKSKSSGKFSRQLQILVRFKCNCGEKMYYNCGISRKEVWAYCSNCEKAVDKKNSKEIRARAFNIEK